MRYIRRHSSPNRVLSTILAAAMLLSLLPLSAHAAETDCLHDTVETSSEVQIETEAGQAVYYAYDPGTGAFERAAAGDETAHNTANREDSRVAVSKTITGTAAENVFDIRLQVTTNQRVLQAQSMPNAGVVLVIDTSGSMNWCMGCDVLAGTGSANRHSSWCTVPNRGVYVTEEQTRLPAAKAAAIAFIEAYAASAGETDASRILSIVSFDNEARTHGIGGLTYVDVTDAAMRSAAIEAIEQGLIAEGGTNVADGLKHADACLTAMLGEAENGLTAETAFVVLLGDGRPQSVTPEPPNNGYTPYHTSRQLQAMGAESGDYTKYQYAEMWAKKIRQGSGAKLYTVYVTWKGAGDTGYQWFHAVSDDCRLVSDAEHLVRSFDGVIALLRIAAKAWEVSDRMGEHIRCVPGSASSNHASIEGDTLRWILRADVPVVYRDGKETSLSPQETEDLVGDFTFLYTMTYQIQLTPTEENADRYTLTNGETRLDYYLTDENGDLVNDEGETVAEEDGLLSLHFKVPAVRGDLGSFAFEKRNELGTPLSGFVFRLEGKEWEASATAIDGQVRFTGIPSGSRYVLSEDGRVIPPEYQGIYATSDVRYDVVLRYGEVFVLEEGTDKVLAHVGSPDCPKNRFAVENPYLTGALTLCKADDGAGENGFQPIDPARAFQLDVTFAGDESLLDRLEALNGITLTREAGVPNVGTYTTMVSIREPAVIERVPVGLTYAVREVGLDEAYAAPGYRDDAGNDITGARPITADGAAVHIGNRRYAGPSVEVEKTIKAAENGEGSFAPGEQAVFTIVVKNDGGQPIERLTLLDQINGTGEGLEVYWIDPEGHERLRDTDAMTILPGDSEVFKVYYTVTGEEARNAEGEAENHVTAKVTYRDGTTGEGSDRERFRIDTPHITLAKGLVENSVGQVEGGSYQATYTLLVTNTGDATAYKVTVDDVMEDAGRGALSKLGAITMEGKTYDTFADIPAFDLAPGRSKTITYTYRFDPNQWDADDLLDEATQSAINAWLSARDAYEAADLAYEEALAAYERALAEAKAAATVEEAAVDAAKEALTPLESAYQAAQNAVDRLYAQQEHSVLLFQQAMERYLKALEEGDAIEPPEMPVEEDYIIDNSEAIEEAEAVKAEAEGPYLAALADYNAAVENYNKVIAVDREDYGMTARYEDYIEKAEAFHALEDLSVTFDLDKLPGPHSYQNTASVRYRLTPGGKEMPGGSDTALLPPIQPQITPRLAIDKLVRVSADGGATWSGWRHLQHVDGTEGLAQFRMTIRNIGPAALDGILWSDRFDGADVTAQVKDFGFDGTLDVNESATFEWQTELRNDAGRDLVKSNTLHVSYRDDAGETVSRSVSATVVIPAAPTPFVTVNKEALQDGKWVKKATLVSDEAQSVRFRITLANEGSADAEVTLTDLYQHMTFNADGNVLAYEPTGESGRIDRFYDEDGTPVGRTVPVPAGGRAVVYADLTVEPGAYIVNKVTAAYGDGEEDGSEAIVSVTPRPKAYFSVEKQVVVGYDAAGEPQVEDELTMNAASGGDGDTLIYRIIVRNRGAVKGSVTLRDDLPGIAGTLYLGSIEEGAAVLTPVLLEAPAFGMVTLYYVAEGASAGVYRNTAAITLPEGSQNVILKGEDDATITLRGSGKAHLTLRKEVRLRGADSAFTKALTHRVSSRDDTVEVEFRITVQNTGLAAVRILENALIDTMTNRLGDAGGYITSDLSVLARPVTLEGGASKVYTVLATLPVGDVTNTVTLEREKVVPVSEGDVIDWPAGSEGGLTGQAEVTVTYRGTGGGGTPAPGGETPAPPPDEGEEPPEEEIVDEDVPLGPAPAPEEPDDRPAEPAEPPEDLIIVEEDVPLGDLPQTGSGNRAGLLATLFGALGLLGLSIRMRGRRGGD